MLFVLDQKIDVKRRKWDWLGHTLRRDADIMSRILLESAAPSLYYITMLYNTGNHCTRIPGRFYKSHEIETL